MIKPVSIVADIIIDLTPPQRDLLLEMLHIQKHDPQGAISIHADVGRRNTLRALEKKGLVVQTGTIFVLTERGDEVARELATRASTDPTEIAIKNAREHKISPREPQTVPLPMAIGVAVVTGRPELLTPLMAEIRQGKQVLTPEQQVELLRCFANLIGDLVVMRGQFDRMNLVVEALDDFHSGLGKKVGELEELIADAKEARETPHRETAREQSQRRKAEKRAQED